MKKQFDFTREEQIMVDAHGSKNYIMALAELCMEDINGKSDRKDKKRFLEILCDINRDK